MEFEYNITRMATTAMLNIQLAQTDRITPSQLWPDWSAPAAEPEPELNIAGNRAAIDFLRQKAKVN